ncbi:MAG TPA: amidohydrolase family protein, partial [Pyrinomonadaceae bacterium]
PGRFADMSELVALSGAAAKRGGLYVSHIRDEGRGGVAAVKEALEIGRRSNAQTHISHFKCSGPTQWHTAGARLRLLDDARAAGQDVTIDVYPYDRSSTTTDILLPDWALKDGRAGLREALKSAQGRARLHADIVAYMRENGWNDLKHVALAAGRPEWVGRTLAEVPTPAADADGQVENLIKVSAAGGAQAIYADMDEGDVDAVVKYPFCVFGSDSAVRDPDMVYKPHPRGSGTFPRIFGSFVHDTRSLELAQAVRKATGQAADIFHLAGRGYLRRGAWADIVIFDPDRIQAGADYDRPFDSPTGIDYVLVNGVVALDHGNLTGNRPAGMPVRGAVEGNSLASRGPEDRLSKRD